MKKLLYTLAAGASLLAACQPGNSYKVAGTIEGLNDGDTVYLQKVEGRNFEALDSTVVANGSFEFKGTTDTTELRYVTYKLDGRMNGVNFFLEKGNIQINATKDHGKKITGTPNNDIYGVYAATIDSMYTEMEAIYKSFADTTLTEEARKAKSDLLDEKDDACTKYTAETMKANIANPVGLYLLKVNYGRLETAELDEVMALVPEQYQNDETIVNIKEQLEIQKKTAVGQKFTDFELKTPEGESVKLSDFVAKNKVTLVDFWASWCGPCRGEMPNVVKAYADYKSKGFGIVGVSLDNDAEAWKGAIKELNITWPQMSDLKGWDCEGSKLYAVRGIPSTVLIDQEGTILAKDLRGEAIAEKLNELLK